MGKLQIKATAVDTATFQLLATVSHEIRTSMDSVLGMLIMLPITPLDSMQNEFAQTTQECGKTLLHLINDVLDIATFESRKFVLECISFAIYLILDDVASMFFRKSGGKNIELAVFVADKVSKVVGGDLHRFKQAVTNIVNNCFKFMAQGHIIVQVYTAENWKRLAEGKTENCVPKATMDRVNFIPKKGLYNSMSSCEAADGRNYWVAFRLLMSHEFYRVPYDLSDIVGLVVSVEDKRLPHFFLPLSRGERSDDWIFFVPLVIFFLRGMTLENEGLHKQISKTCQYQYALEEKLYHSSELQRTIPAIAMVAGLMGAFSSEESGGLEMGGFVAVLSLFAYDLLWANQREILWSKLAIFNDREGLMSFLFSKRIVVL